MPSYGDAICPLQCGLISCGLNSPRTLLLRTDTAAPYLGLHSDCKKVLLSMPSVSIYSMLFIFYFRHFKVCLKMTGAVTLRRMTLSRMASRKMKLSRMTQSTQWMSTLQNEMQLNDIQQNDTQKNDTQQKSTAEWHSAEWNSAKWHSAEKHIRMTIRRMTIIRITQSR